MEAAEAAAEAAVKKNLAAAWAPAVKAAEATIAAEAAEEAKAAEEAISNDSRTINSYSIKLIMALIINGTKWEQNCHRATQKSKISNP